MSYNVWPIVWPTGEPPEGTDPVLVERAEYYAGTTLRLLTLGRVGGAPITVMPCTPQCRNPQFGSYSALPYPLSNVDLKATCWCTVGCGCTDSRTALLDAPVGRVDSVVVHGITVEPSAYHVENGNRLVRTDGGVWPTCAGDQFVVTYLNAYPVDAHGSFVGGILAAEFLKGISADKKCKLPASVTSISRQGVNMQIAVGMFPEGQTGITEVDAYTNLWNPNGLKVKPGIYSPDMPAQRQVSWRPW